MQRFTSLPRLKLFKWTRTGGSTTEAENAAWNALHTGVREITLTAADLAGDVRITCTVTGTAGVYGTVQVDTATMIASHTRGESDAGHTFRIEKGDLLLAVPEVEEAPLESDPETDPTEVIEPLPADDGELAEPTDAEGDAAVPDIAEPAEESDLGEGTYIAGEEEAEGYEDPVNDTPDAEYVDVDALPDEDAVKKPKGIDYALEDGYLRVNTGLNGELSAWATVYASEPDKLVEFAYDHNGLRVQKVVKTTAETVTTEHILHGKLVVHQQVTTISAGGTTATEEMYFFYDAQSRPAMVEFCGKLYIYRHNLQGDIVAILDSNGNSVVEYDYDAWGRPTRAWSDNSSGLESSLISEYAELKELNPFRYRGYVWDEETGLYYLRSRYYESTWNRFINADSIMQNWIASGHNVFTYCLCNPVNYADHSGQRPVLGATMQEDTKLRRKLKNRAGSLRSAPSVATPALDAAIAVRQNELWPLIDAAAFARRYEVASVILQEYPIIPNYAVLEMTIQSVTISQKEISSRRIGDWMISKIYAAANGPITTIFQDADTLYNAGEMVLNPIAYGAISYSYTWKVQDSCGMVFTNTIKKTWYYDLNYNPEHPLLLELEEIDLPVVNLGASWTPVLD